MTSAALLPCNGKAIQSHGYHDYGCQHHKYHNIATWWRLEKHATPFWALLELFLAAWPKGRKRGGGFKGQNTMQEVMGAKESPPQKLILNVLSCSGLYFLCLCSPEQTQEDFRSPAAVIFTYMSIIEPTPLFLPLVFSFCGRGTITFLIFKNVMEITC